jgi:putative ABC transport system permease protein
MLLAIGIAVLILPFFNQLAGKQLETTSLFAGWSMPLMLALVMLVGLLAGSYPAFYLSSFRPIQVLKGKLTTGFKRSRLRSILVVFQFSISIILIVGTIVIYNQLNFIQSKKVGFDRDQVLALHNTWALDKQINSFRESMLKIPGVENAAVSVNLPTNESFDQNAWFRESTMDANKVVITNNMYIDQYYLPTLGMELKEGRNFAKDFGTDSTAILVNEALVKLLGWKEPLKEVLWSPRNNYRPTAYRVVGVVKDFNFGSMRNKVGPMVLMANPVPGKVILRVNPRNTAAIIKQAENTWDKMVPGQPFSYSFLDADFNDLYKAEQRTGKLFISFAIFAIFIACLGLLGLVTYAAEQRTKEIGIRKVLGARTTVLVALLSKDFARLVLIASLISFPVAWYMMYKWLEDFAYRVSISWWVFAIAGAAALTIALITVSFQAIKAALANPVAALRSE